jgi:hypothetical protein
MITAGFAAIAVKVWKIYSSNNGMVESINTVEAQ